ncbi:MAG: hypothetical protein LC624_12230 [Halobacteriales archaeon]|nr:hypothetical protein [Halobacteriales archaeon]
MDALPTRIALAAERVRAAARLRILAPATADGLAGAHLLHLALARAGRPADVGFGMDLSRDPGEVRIDLHAPRGDAPDGDGPASDIALHPRSLGISDGGLATSGAAYLVAHALDARNEDLAWLGLLGALAGLQDLEARRLTGRNRDVLLRDAQASRTVEARLDLRLRGADTRSLRRVLAEADDPVLPGLSGDDVACATWLARLGIAATAAGRPRRWVDLAREEQRKVLGALAAHLLRTRSASHARRLVGETYALASEPEGSPLRDLRRFAFLVHALARRGELTLARELLDGARGSAVRRALAATGDAAEPPLAPPVAVRGALQHFAGADAWEAEALAALASNLYAAPGVRRDLPLVGIASADHGTSTVAARASSDAQRRGIRLGLALGAAAADVRGSARGDEALGAATIPAGSEPEFLAALDGHLARQVADAAA